QEAQFASDCGLDRGVELLIFIARDGKSPGFKLREVTQTLRDPGTLWKGKKEWHCVMTWREIPLLRFR
ncbi:MAG TPA: hypothetical protein VF749_09145, partial [Candidatus Acidoferrum sp.]